MPTLYRKYRPSIFADVTGQDTIVQTLQNEIKLDRISHAYLFSGPRGVGKTTLARLFAKTVSCEKRKKGSAEPCNECSACTQINAGRHIDIIEIDAASQTGVDNVRENIIDNATVLPTVLKHKIFIIDEVHMLSTSAFNALLKTLEEPPSHIIFILATTELHKLPATVISRCERYTFKKIAYDKMFERLKKLCSEEKVKVDKEVLERITRKSEGGLRDAESLLGQILSLNLKEVKSNDIQMILPLSSFESILQYLGSIIENNPGQAINLVNEQAEEGVNLDQFAYDLLETLRTMLLLGMNTGKNLVNTEFSDETLKQLRKYAASVGSTKLVTLMDMALRRKAEIRSSPLPQLPLELLAVEAAAFLSDNGSTPNAEEFSPKAKEEPTPIAVKKPIAVKSETEPESVISHVTSSIKNVISHISDSPIKTTIENIKEKWSEVTEKTALVVPSLGFILTMCGLEGVQGNVLTISVPYTIHKDKLESPKNRIALEQSLEKTFSEKIRLEFVIVQQQKKEESDITVLAAEFGGEVVG